MRPVVISQTGVGSSAPIPVDIYAVSFQIGIGVTVTGTVNYTVQHTYDDPFAAGGPVKWYNAQAALTGQTADAEGGYTQPMRAVRITVNSGTGTATMRVVQASTIG